MRIRNILLAAILLMTIGFASIATNLFVNGSITIGNDIKDYDIRFTATTLDGIENNFVINEGKKIKYNVSLLNSSELVYEITNNSSTYDVNIGVICTALGNANVNLYTIDTTNTPEVVKASTRRKGSIKINLIGENHEDIVETFECSLTLNSLQTATPKVYGVKRLLSSSETTWERIEDSVDLVANATHDGSEVENDFDSIYPWSEIITYNYNDEKTQETAIFGDSNFKFDGSNGQVLTRIPEFYYQRVVKDGYEYIFISKDEQEGYTKSEAFSVGRYTMSWNETKLYSMSGAWPEVNWTIDSIREYAIKLGSDFGQLDWRYFILQLLYLVEYADYNSQNVLGLGNVNNSVAIASGGCNTLGMKSGTLNNDGKHSVIYRGIEDIFGNIWQFVDGINIKDNVAYINYNPTTYQSDVFGGDYQPLGYVNAQTNDYATALGYDANNPLIALPTMVGGDEKSYVSDYYWPQASSSITNAFVGGSFKFGAESGLWYWIITYPSFSYIDDVGARLLRYK